MTVMTDTDTETVADRELTITRIFDAPRALVWKAWTDPQHVVQWMGPRGFTAMHVNYDFRAGSPWRACLHRDDGTGDLWQGGITREVVEPERLVFTFAWDDENGKPGPETVVTITLAEQHGKTKMTLHQRLFNTKANRDGHNGGWSSSLDRLEEFLARLQAR